MSWPARHWGDRDAVALGLSPLAGLFCTAARIRRAYQTSRPRSPLPVPVIVVGNIAVGGTGKTPLVVWLVRRLGEAGLRPGIVSRGYGGRPAREPRLVTAASDPAQVGDEPVLLAARTGAPVAVAVDRSAAARCLLARHGCDILISDDGLQHYRLPRDLEIAVVDGARRLGNGLCLPAGPLREPASRLGEVDQVVVNGTPGTGELAMGVVGDTAVSLQDPQTVRTLDRFAGQSVHAVAGIGNPSRFFELLQDSGLRVVPHPLPDHHRFTAGDVDLPGTVLMTEKDAVKCRGMADGRHWYVPVDARPEPALEQALMTAVRSLHDG